MDVTEHEPIIPILTLMIKTKQQKQISGHDKVKHFLY